jgi:periplasmic protein CpxP/Spy
MKRLRTSLLAGALLASIAAVGTAPAFAQTSPANGAAQSEPSHRMAPRMLPGQLVEGRIAFLKAELKITPAQEPEWNKFATALRDNAKALDQAIMTARQEHGAKDVVTRIALRSDFATVRAENDVRLLGAIRPLYAKLSPEQQQMANQLFTQHGWHERERHRA